jgi:hypothetical protein
MTGGFVKLKHLHKKLDPILVTDMGITGGFVKLEHPYKKLYPMLVTDEGITGGSFKLGHPCKNLVPILVTDKGMIGGFVHRLPLPKLDGIWTVPSGITSGAITKKTK